MISVNYTSPSMPFRPFSIKKKEKEMSINQIVCAYSAHDHGTSACKYLTAVK